MTQDKILDKLGKIKRMAEGAKAIGSEAEAQAFAEMLQKLLIDHKLEMTDLEFDQFEKEQPVEIHYIDYTKHKDIKIRRTRVPWIEILGSIVAKAHFCRILIYGNTSMLSLVGRKEDVAVAEYTFITLQRTLEHISDKQAYYYRLECARNGQRAGHGFRESFIAAFLQRLQQRLDERLKVATSECTALVRVEKSLTAVNEFMDKNFKAAKALSRQLIYHAEGVKRGVEAANKVNLDGKAVATTESKGQLR
jgi:hypothetical protein